VDPKQEWFKSNQLRLKNMMNNLHQRNVKIS
jgi:hypothetical protein